jgi:hypothetical protein
MMIESPSICAWSSKSTPTTFAACGGGVGGAVSTGASIDEMPNLEDPLVGGAVSQDSW